MMPAVGAMPMHRQSLVQHQLLQKGSKRKVSALFKFKVSALVYVTSHAVTGRLACLTVMPAFVITSVTPAPE